MTRWKKKSKFTKSSKNTTHAQPFNRLDRLVLGSVKHLNMIDSSPEGEKGINVLLFLQFSRAFVCVLTDFL